MLALMMFSTRFLLFCLIIVSDVKALSGTFLVRAALQVQPFVLGLGQRPGTEEHIIPFSMYHNFVRSNPSGIRRKEECWRKGCKGVAADQNALEDVTYDKPCQHGNCQRGQKPDSTLHDEWSLIQLFRGKVAQFVKHQGGVKKVSDASHVFAIEVFCGEDQTAIIFAVLCVARCNPDVVVFALKEAEEHMPQLPITNDDDYSGIVLAYMRGEHVRSATKTEGFDFYSPVGPLEYYTDEELAIYLVKNLDLGATSLRLRLLRCRLYKIWDKHLVLGVHTAHPFGNMLVDIVVDRNEKAAAAAKQKAAAKAKAKASAKAKAAAEQSETTRRVQIANTWASLLARKRTTVEDETVEDENGDGDADGPKDSPSDATAAPAPKESSDIATKILSAAAPRQKTKRSKTTQLVMPEMEEFKESFKA